MPSLSTTESPRLTSSTGFDSFLGAARDRYLGDGHRRVGLRMGQLHVTDHHTVEGAAHVTYPLDWSLKAGVAREPHLSTVDAMRVAEAVHTSLLSHQMPWLKLYGYERSLTVRAGARPCTALDSVPITSVVSRPDPTTVRLKHVIGTLKVEAEWIRSEPPTVTDHDWRTGRVSDVRLETDSRVSCFYERKNATLSSVSFLEMMTLAAQMSQVALYRGHSEQRAQSGNMWMRRAGFVRHTPTPRRVAVVELELRNRREMTVGDRAVSTADVIAEDLFGVQVTASLATGN